MGRSALNAGQFTIRSADVNVPTSYREWGRAPVWGVIEQWVVESRPEIPYWRSGGRSAWHGAWMRFPIGLDKRLVDRPEGWERKVTARCGHHLELGERVCASPLAGNCDVYCVWPRSNRGTALER